MDRTNTVVIRAFSAPDNATESHRSDISTTPEPSQTSTAMSGSPAPTLSSCTPVDLPPSPSLAPSTHDSPPSARDGGHPDMPTPPSFPSKPIAGPTPSLRAPDTDGKENCARKLDLSQTTTPDNNPPSPTPPTPLSTDIPTPLRHSAPDPSDSPRKLQRFAMRAHALLEDRKAETAHLRARVRDLETTVATSALALAEQRAALAKRERAHSDLKRRAREKIEAVRERETDALLEKAEVKSRLVDARMEVERREAEIAELGRVRGELEARLAIVRAQKERADGEKEGKETELVKVTTDFLAMQAMAIGAEADLKSERQKSRLLEDQLHEARGRLNALVGQDVDADDTQPEMPELAARLAQANQDNATLRASLESARRVIIEKDHELGKVERELRHVKEKHAVEVQSLRNEEAQAKRAHSVEVGSLEAKVGEKEAALKQSGRALDTETRRREETAANLESALSELNGVVKLHQELQDDLRRSLEEQARLNDSLFKLETAVAVERREKVETQSKLRLLEQTLEEGESERRNAEADMVAMEAEISRLKESELLLCRKVEEQLEIIESSTSNVHVVEKQFKTQSSEITRRRTETRLLHEKAEALEKRLSTLSDTNEELGSEVERLSGSLREKTTLLSSLKAAVQVPKTLKIVQHKQCANRKREEPKKKGGVDLGGALKMIGSFGMGFVAKAFLGRRDKHED